MARWKSGWNYYRGMEGKVEGSVESWRNDGRVDKGWQKKGVDDRRMQRTTEKEIKR